MFKYLIMSLSLSIAKLTIYPKSSMMWLLLTLLLNVFRFFSLSYSIFSRTHSLPLFSSQSFVLCHKFIYIFYLDCYLFCCYCFQLLRCVCVISLLFLSTKQNANNLRSLQLTKVIRFETIDVFRILLLPPSRKMCTLYSIWLCVCGADLLSSSLVFIIGQLWNWLAFRFLTA